MARSRSAREILVAELRESFGRVVYTHKCHEKEADLNKALDERLRLAQLVLAVFSSGSAVSSILAEWAAFPYIAATVATALAIVTGYAKSSEAQQRSGAHSATARRLWLVREQYLSLLADVEAEAVTLDEARGRRDKLQLETAEIYESAPRTSPKAYSQAQKALKVSEELTFSDGEIDLFLPAALRRATDPAAAAPVAPDESTG